MISLEYFLDEKWYKKNLSKLKDNRFLTKLPGIKGNKFSWKFRENVQQDRFLFDYLAAYRVDRMEKTYRGFNYFEIISFLLIDGNLKEDKPASVLYKNLVQLNNDRLKPNSYDLKLMRNILQVYDLIYQNNFPLNEENFELVVHILFLGLDSSLDSLSDRKRTKETPSAFHHLLDPGLIDQEMHNFWEYLKDIPENDFSGFTKAFILGLEFLYISPFQSLNLMMMQFIIKWYLFQLDNDFTYLGFGLLMGVNFETFVEVIDELFATDFNCDRYLALFRLMTKNQANMMKRFYWMVNSVKKPLRTKKEFNADDLRFFMSCLMLLPSEFNEKMIEENPFINQILNGKEVITTKLNQLVNLEVLQRSRQKNKDYYIWANPDYHKINHLLVDEACKQK
ncbi:hypothetical protein LD125_00014 [Mesoplasma sp. JKS002658]|uniref:hypothetical protein n=1 Tax=Mesoplasma whartonense TaxID=2878854 RepID=UPI002022B4CB|nr:MULTISPECIES: hypothetical protein [unclassified Mesoplasma]MCL8211736.1 hypothetical protein [Mesoplasma sp. JKS002664]MCL8212113.1 hypothetical protein [Mesoplasma sp. JKS002662]MCL8212736.1 hypothetical protein [Mesoplasma sp. JKS002661]MCL8213650.1 hypothetical protein [Mesoplasma sp. JKS002660]MCL8213782.1 hypothetical protein [Mesoplasma sp. JKS002658]